MYLRYLAVWLLLAVVAIANGIVRESTYGRRVGELAAHQISTVTAIIASGAVVWLCHRTWPMESMRQAWAIGATWFLMTIAFEFGFGHFVAGHTWERLLADYDLAAGRVWILFLAWVLVMPAVIVRLAD